MWIQLLFVNFCAHALFRLPVAVTALHIRALQLHQPDTHLDLSNNYLGNYLSLY